ncbi:MAG: 2Fe-2S iron-sulfur cluster-binding protein [Candidatus Binatia bacterium]
MGFAIASFARSFFFPPAAAPLRREPNRRWKRTSAASSLLHLKVADVINETPDTRTFVFEEEGLAYRAGQHLTLVVNLDGQTHRRCYSFSSSPAAAGRSSITVKRVEGGLLSNWLHDRVRTGDVLRATPASGRFTLEPDASESRHIVMVAGGVGITPLISMAETTLRAEPGSRVTLLYGSRSEDEIIFRTRLERLAEEFGERFDLRFAVDEGAASWPGLTGKLGGERVVATLGHAGPAQWFICGPEAMMQSVVAALGRAGVADERIHLERFQYAESSTARMPQAPASLVFRASGMTISAPVGTTILEAAEQAGIALPSSCRMGGCGACKVKIDGRVASAEPNCLTDQERAEGYALACCSWGDGRVELRDF